MIIPDLDKELAYWRVKLNLPNWQITMRYEVDPRAPDTGAPVYGYCLRQVDVPRADIVIRLPVTAADVAETYDTIIHELLHCRIANPEASIVVEEQAVWALAPLLTELRLTAPTKADALCKALARGAEPRPYTRTLPAAQVRARAGERYKMDEEKSAALAALAMQAGELMAGGQVPEEMKAILQQLIALAAGGAAPVAEAPEDATPQDPALGMKDEPKPGDKPAMKAEIAALLQKIQFQATGGDTALKALQEQMAADRAAAVDGLLDTRGDIGAKPRAILRELGLREGVAKLREHLIEVVPAKAEAKVETRAKLGEGAAIRGGAGGVTMAKVSGDAKVDRLFRLAPDASEGNGFKISDRSDGKLCTASIAGALATVRAATKANIATARNKMGLGPQEAS